MGVLIDRTTYFKPTVCQPGQGYQLRGSKPQPSSIIVHTTNGAKGSVFAKEAQYLQESQAVGAHYLIGKRGQIVRFLVPQLHIAWHTGDAKPGFQNAQAIGIELHFTPGDSPTIPQPMLDSLTLLVLELCQVHATIGDLRTAVDTHRAVALPSGRKIDPSGFDDLAFYTWRDLVQCRREGQTAA